MSIIALIMVAIPALAQSGGSVEGGNSSWLSGFDNGITHISANQRSWQQTVIQVPGQTFNAVSNSNTGFQLNAADGVAAAETTTDIGFYTNSSGNLGAFSDANVASIAAGNAMSITWAASNSSLSQYGGGER